MWMTHIISFSAGQSYEKHFLQECNERVFGSESRRLHVDYCLLRLLLKYKDFADDIILNTAYGVIMNQLFIKKNQRPLKANKLNHILKLMLTIIVVDKLDTIFF